MKTKVVRKADQQHPISKKRLLTYIQPFSLLAQPELQQEIFTIPESIKPALQIKIDSNCRKQIYHIAYNIFIIKNNSPIITKEQKDIIQKIHDKQMPQTFLDELREIIEEL